MATQVTQTELSGDTIFDPCREEGANAGGGLAAGDRGILGANVFVEAQFFTADYFY